MHPSEAIAALAADKRLGIVFDRRRLDGRRAPPADLKVVEGIELAAGGGGVSAALVTPTDGAELPRRDRASPQGQIRLMDRFYLPAIRDQAVVTPMFDMVAGIYDTLTDQRLNLETASLLLKTVLVDTGTAPKILDFGCGTGVASDALASLATSAELLGVDLSNAMLARAQCRGLAAMPIAAWRLRPPPVDGAIANFVLHYDVPAADMWRIAQSLKPGALFAGNLFGAEPELAERVTRELTAAGLVPKVRTPLLRTGRPDLLLVFRRPW